MSSVDHHVQTPGEKGLKMKIKRKNVGNSSKTESKHEIVKPEGSKSHAAAAESSNPSNSVNGSQDKNKQAGSSLDKDKSPYKSKTANKKDKNKDKGGNKNSDSGSKNNEGGATSGSSGNHASGSSKVSNGVPSGSGNSGSNAVNGLDEFYQQEPKIGDVAQTTVKKESESLDPYDFNTDDDGITLPAKKVKIEKVESASSPMQSDSHHIGVETCTVGVSTEPDCLGPCEPGTSVNLEGIVWHETENGVLVVNVTWRGKTYVGTLLDATKHDWAPPRFNCDSPVSDFETRTPKGRGKRNRGPPAGTPVVEKVIQEGRKLRKGRRGSSNTFQAPPSPAKSDVSSSGGVKRKGRSADIEVNNERAKRCRSSSRGPATPAPEVNLTPNKDGLIECPEPNCSKKYKHMNGLRYHQTHAHLNPLAALNAEEDMDDKDDEDVKPEVIVKSEKKDSKSDSTTSEKVCSRATRERDSIEDNIPLKEIAASCRANANRSSPEKNNSTEKVSDKSAEKASGEKQTEKSDKKSDKNTSGKSDDKKCDSSNTSKHDTSSKRKEVVESSANSSANVVVNSSSSSSLSSSSSSSSSISGKSSTIQNQVFQISGASVAALGANVVPSATNGATKVTQSRTSLVTTPVVTPTGSPPSNPLPITVPAMSTPPHAVDFSKTDKSKNKTVTRPIVPAPSPQMIALSSNVSVSHANMSPVSTHAQMSPLLKPIQPKPTIMGEPSNINPALMGLKDKKVKPKKKKENPQQVVGGSANINNNSNKSPSSIKDPSSRDDPSKSDRPAVIKNAANPSRPCDRKDKNPSHGESGKAMVDMSRKMSNMDMSRNPNQTLPPAMNLPKSDQAGNRLSTPSNLMKVNSPLQVSTDRKTPVTDDVQSPAYSDISDANESNGSPQQGDSPSKKESSSMKKSEQGGGSQPPPQDGSNVPHYGMYGYYGQSPYMMQPNVPSSQHLSPNTGKPLPQGRDSGASTSTEERKQGEDSSKTTIKIEDKDENKVGKPDGPPQQMNDYHQQQKWFQQFYSQIQTLPPQAQYQYLARYGGYMEPSYQMHMINSDPNLRQQYEKAMEEQKRAQEQQGSSSNNSSGKPESSNMDSKKSNSRPASREHPMDQQSVMKMGQPHLPGAMEGGQDMKKAMGDRAGDQSLREKQNENHQIMKENIELKSQMDRDRNRYEYDYRKQEEMRRYQMFQQQKLIEQQRLEKRKQEMAASKPPELTSAESPGGKHHSRQEAIKAEDLVKREHGEARVRDYRDSNPGGASSGPSKVSPDVKSEDKLRSPDTNPRTPNHSLPTPSPGASSSVQSPGQGAIPYNAYMQYPGAYLQSPHYGQMHFDPGQAMYRNMNPHVLGYAASPYLHPAQMGGQLNYRVSVETEKEKVLDPKSAGSSLEVEKPVEGPAGPNYFGNNHKIHELHDKARPSSHASSPVPQKSVDSSPHQNMEKNREHAGSPPTQRHIHTHHHTHVVGPYPLVHGAALLPPPPQATPTLPHSFNTK